MSAAALLLACLAATAAAGEGPPRAKPEELKALQAEVQGLADKARPHLDRLARLAPLYAQGDPSRYWDERRETVGRIEEIRVKVMGLDREFSVRKRAFELERGAAAVRDVLDGKRSGLSPATFASVYSLETFHRSLQEFGGEVYRALQEDARLWELAVSRERRRRKVRTGLAGLVAAAALAACAYLYWRRRRGRA